MMKLAASPLTAAPHLEQNLSVSETVFPHAEQLNLIPTYEYFRKPDLLILLKGCQNSQRRC